jgi:hypothetical protein
MGYVAGIVKAGIFLKVFQYESLRFRVFVKLSVPETSYDIVKVASLTATGVLATTSVKIASSQVATPTAST